MKEPSPGIRERRDLLAQRVGFVEESGDPLEPDVAARILEEFQRCELGTLAGFSPDEGDLPPAS